MGRPKFSIFNFLESTPLSVQIQEFSASERTCEESNAEVTSMFTDTTSVETVTKSGDQNDISNVSDSYYNIGIIIWTVHCDTVMCIITFINNNNISIIVLAIMLNVLHKF